MNIFESKIPWFAQPINGKKKTVGLLLKKVENFDAFDVSFATASWGQHYEISHIQFLSVLALIFL